MKYEQKQSKDEQNMESADRDIHCGSDDKAENPVAQTQPQQSADVRPWVSGIHKKVIVVCMIAVAVIGLVVYAVVSANSGQKNIMLSQAKDQVKSISLRYGTSSGSYNNEQATDVIDWIYSDIQNTRASKGVITDAEKRKVGQPMFTLAVYYKNGREDVIASDSSGGYIYRILTDRTFDYPLAVSMQESDLAGDSFIGGGNGDLADFVTQGGRIH